MIFYESKSYDPYFNLALEEYFFEHMDKNEQYFILWQNLNTIVVGKHQNTVEEINEEYVSKNNIKVVRRLSGGGAVFHDEGNLNFTFIVDDNAVPDFNFEVFIVPVVKVLEKIGIKAEFNGRNDIVIEGKKFSGNSQYAKNGRLLHHGCIMLNSNIDKASEALKVKECKFESKSAKSVRSRMTTINSNTDSPVTMDIFKAMLKEQISKSGEVTSIELTDSQLAEINALKEKKYSTWEWNYGKSPSYNVRREKRFPSGIITVFMNVEKGYIRAINIYGDFFGNGNITELENELIGLPLSSDIINSINRINIGHYINGITPQDFYELLMF